jgi:transposase InsO family protein
MAADAQIPRRPWAGVAWTEASAGLALAMRAGVCAGTLKCRARPYTPRTNGKAERFIQTALREWAYAASYASSNERASELPRWLHEDNPFRNHKSLQSQTAMSRVGQGADNVLRLHRYSFTPQMSLAYSPMARSEEK